MNMTASSGLHAPREFASVSERMRGAALSVDSLSKSFGAVAALKEVSLKLGYGEIRALCGENGAGKSTLIKLLTGYHVPSGGSIRVGEQVCEFASPRDAQEAGIALVSQELSLCPDLSVEDNIWLGSLSVPFLHRRAALRRRAREALDLLGMQHVALAAPLSQLSIGERQLVEIARMLTRDAQILLLDEPTATLSDREIDKMCSALLALKREGRSIIYITHRLGEIFQICDSITVLRNGQLVGNMQVADTSRNELIEMMLGRPFEEFYPAAGESQCAASALEVSGLTIPGAVEDFNVVVPKGKIVCLAGQIGSGSEVVTKAIAGLVHTAEGQVKVMGRELKLGSGERALRANVMYVSGERAEEGVFRDLTVHENLVATRLDEHSAFGILKQADLKRKALELASQVQVDAARLNATADQLSGGNQQKLAFGRCIDRGDPGVIVMNEPTRGIDVGARAEIYQLMRDFCEKGYGLLVASTDLEEVVGLGDVVVTMYRGRQVASYRREEVTIQHVLADLTHPDTH
jgi:ABC-type sugar transport system ATPase subunit